MSAPESDSAATKATEANGEVETGENILNTLNYYNR